MSHDHMAAGHGEHGWTGGWQTAARMLQDAAPLSVPDGASAMTILSSSCRGYALLTGLPVGL
ncbi:hypothetical protein ABZ723_33275 [Streptomyces sp. NPDC006700]